MSPDCSTVPSLPSDDPEKTVASGSFQICSAPDDDTPLQHLLAGQEAALALALALELALEARLCFSSRHSVFAYLVLLSLFLLEKPKDWAVRRAGEGCRA